MSLFTGATYEPKEDDERLSSQMLRVYFLMKDKTWRTLAEIHEVTGDPPASISAQLRHLRKPKFGEYTVDKRHRGLRKNGLYEYCVLSPGSVATHLPPPKTKGAGFLAGLKYAESTMLSAGSYEAGKLALANELRRASSV
jgi:hypothetical protein